MIGEVIPVMVSAIIPPIPDDDFRDGGPIQVVIFDIDGTVSNPEKRKKHILKEPKNWKAFHEEAVNDEPFEHIADLAYLIHEKHPHWSVVLATGRDDTHREATIAWLSLQSIPYLKLYMRAAGDHRDDSIVKIEMLEQMRRDGYEPVMVFEDRTRVVNAWRAAGIPCLQVAPGDF